MVLDDLVDAIVLWAMEVEVDAACRGGAVPGPAPIML
jgi:hypothetical protein